MGNYSYYGYCELTVPDIVTFTNWLIAKRIETENDSEQDYLYKAVVFNDVINGDKTKPNAVFLDIHGWKIWGYWYKPFKMFLAQLYLQGVRGVINMEEEQGYEFEIQFKESGVFMADIGLWEYYDKTGGNELDEPILDESHAGTWPLVFENGKIDEDGRQK